MNVKFKETVLDDDAKMYQASKDTVTKEDIKKLSGKQKIVYFKDYYLKICLAIILCGIFVGSMIYTSIINPSSNVLSIIALNGSYIKDEEEMSNSLESIIGMEREKDYVSVEYVNSEDYQMNMAFFTRVAAGDVDLIICTYSDFAEQAKKGIFADLREYLPQETYKSLTDRIMLGKIVETDTDGNIISSSEDIPLGIDLFGSKVCAEYIESLETPVLCVAASSHNTDNALKAIAYLVEQ